MKEIWLVQYPKDGHIYYLTFKNSNEELRETFEEKLNGEGS